MKPISAFATLLVVVIVSMLSVLPVAAAYRPKPEIRPTYNAKPEQIEGLPDYNDPTVKLKLECSACKVLVNKVHAELSTLFDLRHSKPRSFEVVEVTESMCQRIRDGYGLLMRNNMATTEFSGDEKITRMKGSWINTFLENRCGHILSHYEEAIIHNFPKMKNRVEDLQKLVCYKLDRKCAAAEYTHEDL